MAIVIGGVECQPKGHLDISVLRKVSVALRLWISTYKYRLMWLQREGG